MSRILKEHIIMWLTLIIKLEMEMWWCRTTSQMTAAQTWETPTVMTPHTPATPESSLTNHHISPVIVVIKETQSWSVSIFIPAKAGISNNGKSVEVLKCMCASLHLTFSLFKEKSINSALLKSLSAFLCLKKNVLTYCGKTLFEKQNT